MNKLTSAVKVLVVDDQPLIVEELCEFLESSGYRCVPCESSQQAIERFSEDAEIGLVLSDLHMPDMDGIQLVQELQRISGKHRVFEAIMLTGRADKQDVIKALRAGIADYYQKPIELNELLEGVKRQDAALQAKFAPLAAALTREEGRIIGELNGSQGKPVDIGGYYRPDVAKASAAMRPSSTFNSALSAL